MTDNKSDGLLIYHVFADRGIESEVLSGFGRVVRLGIDPDDGFGGTDRDGGGR